MTKPGRSKEEREKNKCNKRVVVDTMAATGESKALIEHAAAFYFNFIANKIEEGSFEIIRVINFGSFRAKTKSIQMRDYMKSLPETYRKLIRGR